MSRPGDWNCRSCSHLNFQRRESCQRCGEGRPAGDQRGGDYGGGFGGRSGGGGGGGGSFGFTTGPDVRPGDWYCGVGNCNAHNFASRANCYKCGASKEESSAQGGGAGGYEADMPRMRGGYGFGSGGGGGGGSSRSGWKSGDWICTRSNCNEHNFASRMECFRCNAPRDTNAAKSPY